ncbi:hypothetical protein ACPPVO_44655 [Dactylosporangium sp. McL0621]|uniref:hypothetical protein n=1 Tax=Dactylosporangium sp. McL0621 TaxID=3415678 RepID=UPI003CECBFA5
MNRVRKVLLTAAAALLTVGAGVDPARADTAESYCLIELVSLTAANLWHDGGKDWIWFVMDGYYFPGNNKSVPFYQGTSQTSGAFGNANELLQRGTGPVTLQVVLDRTWPTANVVIDSNQVSCSLGNGQTLRFSDGDATYNLTYNVN